MEVTSEYIDKIEGAYQYNNPASVRLAETMLIKIISSIITEEEIFVSSESLTIKSLTDFDNWIKSKSFKMYDSSTLIKIMKGSD